MNELEKWSENLETRNLLIDFLHDLNKKNIHLCEPYTGTDLYVMIMKKYEDVVDEFLGIDQIQLEKERRKLLEEFVKRNEEKK